MTVKAHYFSVKVTAKAPQGFTPATMTVSGLGVSENANAEATIEALAIEQYKKGLAETNPGVEFAITATATNQYPQFVVADVKIKKTKSIKEPTLPAEPAGE